MEERTIKLSLDKAKEYYKAGGELRNIALQAFGKGEILDIALPNTWDECLEILQKEDNTEYSLAMLAHQAEPAQAYYRLRCLRECYRQGWEPDWSDSEQTKYCIVENDGIAVEKYWEARQFLAFQTQEIAEKFLKNFRDIIIKADIL